MKDYSLENRRYVIGGIATFIVVVYLVRLFTLQLLSDDYKKNADSNAFLKKVEFPSRADASTPLSSARLSALPKSFLLSE